MITQQRSRAGTPPSIFVLFPLALLVSLGCSDSNDPPGPAGGVTRISPATFAELGVVPFDVDSQDGVGPNSHQAQYGRRPEIVAVPRAGGVDVVVRHQHGDEEDPRAVLLRLDEGGSGWSIAGGLELPALARLYGFTRGASGDYYYATALQEPNLTTNNPAPGDHRPNVVRAYRIESDGTVVWDADVGRARAALDPDSETLVNPLVASSARLGVSETEGLVGLVAGNNTDPDGGGTRHQKAVSTFLDATGAEAMRNSSIWVSHSFDQRHLPDGDGLIELHLGDAYPRSIVMTRVDANGRTPALSLFWIKGSTGANNTRTRLGGIVPRSDGSLLVAFSTEQTTHTNEVVMGQNKVSGARDLALVHVERDTSGGGLEFTRDDAFGSAMSVDAGGEMRDNRVLWVTNHHAGGAARHVERPKIVALGGDTFLLLWEEWTLDTDGHDYDGVFAARIDAAGAIQAGPTRIADGHLPRGDDAFAYAGGAGWVTGDATALSLTVHLVDASLDYTSHEVQ